MSVPILSEFAIINRIIASLIIQFTSTYRYQLCVVYWLGVDFTRFYISHPNVMLNMCSIYVSWSCRFGFWLRWNSMRQHCIQQTNKLYIHNIVVVVKYYPAFICILLVYYYWISLARERRAHPGWTIDQPSHWRLLLSSLSRSLSAHCLSDPIGCAAAAVWELVCPHIVVPHHTICVEQCEIGLQHCQIVSFICGFVCPRPLWRCVLTLCAVHPLRIWYWYMRWYRLYIVNYSRQCCAT